MAKHRSLTLANARCLLNVPTGERRTEELEPFPGYFVSNNKVDTSMVAEGWLARLIGTHRRSLVVEYWRDTLTAAMVFAIYAISAIALEFTMRMLPPHVVDRRVVSFLHEIDFWVVALTSVFLPAKFFFFLWTWMYKRED